MSDTTHSFEQHFLSLIARGSGLLPAEIRSLISRLIEATVNQHSCIHLADESNETLSSIMEHKAFGGPNDKTPFVIRDDRLYLRRFYRFEVEVASMIAKRNEPISVPDSIVLKQKLDEHFGSESGNRQKLAALLAISRKLAIVTGGPGTGKTSTVVKMLDILLEESPDIDIRLAAPTGKAAMRLGDSIRDWATDRSLDLEVQTLHRLLGMRRDGRTWRHGPRNPVDADLLIVDEASMIDLPMMHRLLSAIPEDSRLILLGDPNQLPSVDTGNVLADLCAGDSSFSLEFSNFAHPFVGEMPTTETTHRLTDAVCTLERSYRFDENSAIGKLALGIQSASIKLDDSDTSVSWHSEAAPSKLLANWQNYLAALESGTVNADILNEAFEKTRILCSRRGGDSGVTKLNLAIEQLLESRGLKGPGETFYTGRPVLVTRNDYNLGLFNGDIGICTPLANDEFVVRFPGKSEGILAPRLPDHETCFAMTVHKAQGSEFDHVMLVLGSESSEEASSLMTRELVYTAITRARKNISVYAKESTWQKALSRRSTRVSGMTHFLGIENPPGDDATSSDPGQRNLF